MDGAFMSPPGFLNGDATTNLSLPAIEQQLEALRSTDVQRDALIKQLANLYFAIKLQYEQKRDDYENEAQSRLEWQRKCREKERELNALRNSIDSKPFVVALIDGDGAPFLDEILQSGIKGGEKAAVLLHTEIRRYVEGLFERSAGADWTVIVQIFTNLDGMARKLYACGKISGQAEFLKLIQEFNTTAPLFSFVDVGQGKERADNRMRENFRHYYGNPQCKHIIFGGCHDTGYDNTLRQYKHDFSASGRISLLETIPAHHLYRDYQGFKMIKFASVFRSEPLPDKPLAPTPAPAALPPPGMPHPQPPLFTPGGANRPIVPQLSATPQLQGIPAIPPQPPAPVKQPSQPKPAAGTGSATSSSAISTPGTTPGAVSVATEKPIPRAASPEDAFITPSWATVGKNGATLQNYAINPTKSGGAPLRSILLNNNEERIDRPLPPVSKADQQALWDRINQTGKVCNEHYLRGACDKGKSCTYSHEYKLTSGQLKALAYRARTLACANGGWCRDFDCYQGHHCMVDDCGKDCHFKDWHNMDKHIAYKYLENDDIVEYHEKQLYEGH